MSQFIDKFALEVPDGALIAGPDELIDRDAQTRLLKELGIDLEE